VTTGAGRKPKYKTCGRTPPKLKTKGENTMELFNKKKHTGKTSQDKEAIKEYLKSEIAYFRNAITVRDGKLYSGYGMFIANVIK
jgi:hypothetical protein